MRGIVYGFENCVGFVEDTEQYCFRPTLTEMQEKRYNGHQKEFFHSGILWIDVYDVIINIYCSLDGVEQDRRMYSDCHPYRYPSLVLRPTEG